MQPSDPSGSPSDQAFAGASGVMLRLTLSTLERAGRDPGLWREAELHRAVLVSGLSVMVNGLALLQRDLG
jgi:hypothetical protein